MTATHFKPIEWGTPRPSDETCPYDHLIGTTPLGRFLITWKGWKEYDNHVVDEVPWGDADSSPQDLWGSGLDGAKAECERAWQERLESCLLPEATP